MMSNPSARSLHRFHYPIIRTHVNTGTEPKEQEPIPDNICPTYKTSSQDYSARRTTNAASSTPSSKNFSLPIFKVEISCRLSRPLSTQPAFRLSSGESSPVRFHHTTRSLIPPPVANEDIGSNPKGRQEFGISENPIHHDASQIRSPAIENTETAGKSKQSQRSNGSTNIAPHIERNPWKFNAFGNGWLLEIISWLLSAICMCAIVGVLILLRNRRAQDWPAGLVLISVLSKVASAALLLLLSEATCQLKWLWFHGESKKVWNFEIYDNASRGPWDSLLLFIRTKGANLAALGAAIIIFAIAVDPFYQQAIIFPTRLALNTTLNGTVPRVLQYRPHYDRETRIGVEMALPEQDMQTVLLGYLYRNGTQQLPLSMDPRPDIPISCPTSNCTWPEYDTFAVCSDCKDISELLTYKCLSGDLDWIANVAPNGQNANGSMCGWFINATDVDTANQPILMSGYRESSLLLPNEEALLTRVLPLVTNPMRKPLYGNGSYRFKDIQNPLLDFFVVSASNGVESVYLRQRPVAQECMLAWCVKTLKSSYLEGVYEEKVMNVFMNMTATEFPWRSEGVETPFENSTYLTYDQDVYFELNNTVFGTSNTTVVRTIYAYDDYFPSVFTQANDSDTAFLRYKIQKSENAFPFLRNISFNPFLAPNNVTNHMDRLAKALTTMMRSSDEREWVFGEAYNKKTFVHVRWAWLSLPLVLLFSTFFFLAATVIKSSPSKENLDAWKTSSVPTLPYGLPDDMRKKIEAPIQNNATNTPLTKVEEQKAKMLPKTHRRISGNRPPSPAPKVRQNQPPPGWI